MLTLYAREYNTTLLSVHHRYRTRVDPVGETVGGIFDQGRRIAFVPSEKAAKASSVTSVTVHIPLVTLDTKGLGRRIEARRGFVTVVLFQTSFVSSFSIPFLTSLL